MERDPRQPQVDHLLSSDELRDRATEVCLRARATKALVLGFALVDASLKVEQDPIRARATELAKAKSAKARGKAKAAEKASGSPSPRPHLAGDGSSPLTTSAQGAGGRGLLTSEGACAARRLKTSPPNQSGHNGSLVAACLRVAFAKVVVVV